jgi:hypothetical protein
MQDCVRRGCQRTERTLPAIAAQQPLDANRKAAEQVLTLADAEVVAVQVAASMTLAALLWPLIPRPTRSPTWPARWASGYRCARSRSSRWSRYCPGRDGARRRVGGGARGRRDHPGG